jgi:hypothetical protein
MGGTVAVCVRHHDGSLVCGHAYTGALSPFHHDVRFIDDEDAWLTGPPIDADLGEGSLAPCGYGLVLYDRVTRTIVSLSSHATPGQKAGAFVHLLFEGIGYEDQLPAWEALNARGLVSTRPWFTPGADTRTLDPRRRLADQLDDIDSRELVSVDMAPWKVVDIREEDARGDLERALADIGIAIPETTLAEWDRHFDE